MKVVCPDQLLSVLRLETRKLHDLSIDSDESDKLIQRVSELMAAESLEDFTSYGSANLQLIAPPPEPRFKMQIQTKLNLIFSPQIEVALTDQTTIDLNLVRSIHLIGLER